MHRSELELKKGSILRKELIEDIYYYPRIATETYYSGYSDGILYGLEWKNSKQKEGHHIITPGALKYHGEIYFLREHIEVEDLLCDQIRIDKKYRLCFEEREAYKIIETQTIYELKLRVVSSDEYEQIKDKSFYYARVRCMGNKRLETFYDGDVYGLYACEDGYEFKLPNWIVEEKLIKIMIEKRNKHPLDYIILNDVYAKRGLSVSIIDMYLKECGIRLSESDYNSPGRLLEEMVKAVELLKFEASIKESKNEQEIEIQKAETGGGLLL